MAVEAVEESDGACADADEEEAVTESKQELMSKKAKLVTRRAYLQVSLEFSGKAQIS